MSEAPALSANVGRDAEIAALKAKLEEQEDELNKLWSAIRSLNERVAEGVRRWR